MNQLLSRSIGENVEVMLEFQQDLWNVKVDAGQIEGAIINLAINSRDVEDNIVVGRILVRILVGLGYQTLEAAKVYDGDTFVRHTLLKSPLVETCWRMHLTKS
jgi:hypothetical protein